MTASIHIFNVVVFSPGFKLGKKLSYKPMISAIGSRHSIKFAHFTSCVTPVSAILYKAT